LDSNGLEGVVPVEKVKPRASLNRVRSPSFTIGRVSHGAVVMMTRRELLNLLKVRIDLVE